MKKIGIIAKKKHTEAIVAINNIIPFLEKKGVDVIVEDDLNISVDKLKFEQINNIPSLVDVLIVFGGDGTLLSVSRLPAIENVPVLAVNLGGLGFLTEFRLEEINAAIDRVLDDDFTIDMRMMLEVALFRGAEKQDMIFHALNDVVVNKGAMARIIDLDTYVNGSFLNTFKADGLVICTPTGSTGYSLSAGGPIVYPSLSLLALTPICPHTLTNRPIILSGDATVRVAIKTKNEDVFLTMDGQIGLRMSEGDSIQVSKSSKAVSMIKTPFRNYFEVLKEKLNWGKR